MNWAIAQRLWALYSPAYGSSIRGWYTDVEESNGISYLTVMQVCRVMRAWLCRVMVA